MENGLLQGREWDQGDQREGYCSCRRNNLVVA